MSIVGGIWEEPHRCDSVSGKYRFHQAPAEQIHCPVCAPRESLVSRMLSALGNPKSPQIASGREVVFGACEEASLAWDPVDRILVSANGIPHGSDTCGSGSRPEGAYAVLEAWRHYGEDFPRRLCGDFSCAIWDEARRRLLLVADVTDMCGLFFRRAGGSVVFASDPREILSDSRVPREIDDQYMAFFLCNLPLNNGGTFFRSVGRVLPGHMAIFERDGADRYRELRQRKWWQPEGIPALRLGSHGEYADAVRCELDRAVGCCLPREGTAGILMSSGLDSTAIAALAARRLAREGRRLIAGTLVYSRDAAEIQGADWFSDEFPLAARMAEAWPNIDHYRALPDDVPFLEGIVTAIALRGIPMRQPVAAAAYLSLVKFAADHNVSALLAGGFGNFTISYHGGLTASTLLRERRIGRLAAHLAGLRRNGLGWKGIAGRLMPPAVRRSVRRLMGKGDPGLFDFSPIHPELARSMGVIEFVRASHEAETASRFPAGVILNAQRSGSVREAFRRRFHLDPASPAGDRRVIELCLSIPEEQFEWGGRPRALIRTAMKELVPDAILNETRRGEQGRGWERRFQTDFPEIMREIEAIALSPLANRYLDIPRMRMLCERWAAAPPLPGTHDREYRTVLAWGVSTGAFLRRFESGRCQPGSLPASADTNEMAKTTA